MGYKWQCINDQDDQLRTSETYMRQVRTHKD